MAGSLRTRMRVDLRAAMRAGDAVTVSALRTLIAAVENAEAVDPHGAVEAAGLMGDVARRVMGEADEAAVVRAEAEALADAAAEMDRLGHGDRAAELRRQEAVARAYLA